MYAMVRVVVGIKELLWRVIETSYNILIKKKKTVSREFKLQTRVNIIGSEFQCKMISFCFRALGQCNLNAQFGSRIPYYRNWTSLLIFFFF